MSTIFNFKNFITLAAAASLSGVVGCSSQEEITLPGSSRAEIKDGKLIDPRDGNEYGVAKIGDLFWMTENLRYADSTAMPSLKENTWCHQDDKNCSKYGRLYSWTAAMNLEKEYLTVPLFAAYTETQGVCPDGWRVPNTTEWERMLAYVDSNNGDEGNGTSLKSVDGWDKADSVNTPANRFGFNGKASGRRNNDGETFMSVGKYAFFWTATEKDDGTAYGWHLRHDMNEFLPGNFYKDHGMSVRCVTDLRSVDYSGALDSSYLEKIPHDYGTLKIEGKTYRTTTAFGVTWMADNMNLDVKGSHCYNDEKAKCEEYGRLYTLEAAKSICPEGWRLFTWDDYVVVRGYEDKYNDGVKGLRSTYRFLGTNQSGFSLTGAGLRTEKGEFEELLEMFAFFRPEEYEQNASIRAHHGIISLYGSSPEKQHRELKVKGFSVRCTKLE